MGFEKKGSLASRIKLVPKVPKTSKKLQPLLFTGMFAAALGVKEADHDERQGEHEAGDGETEGEVQPVPVHVHVCEGHGDVGPAVVAGDDGVVDPDRCEPGGAVDSRGVAAAPDVDPEPGEDGEVGGLEGRVLHPHLPTLEHILQGKAR